MRFELDGPLNLRHTVRFMTLWGATTWFKADETGAWYAERTPEGPGTVHVVHRGDHLEAEAWGPGADLLLPRVPELFGLNRPGIEALEPQSALVRDLKKKLTGLRFGTTKQVYSRAISAGIAQLVTGANAKPALRRIAWTWGEKAPGPHPKLHLLPAPRDLARRPYYDFHPLNIERHRADLLKRIADRAPALQRAVRMPPEEGRLHLMKLRGIGPWTSGVVMACALGDTDAVPVGDWHLPNIVSWHLAGEDRGTDERMLELLEPYRGMRGVVARMLKSGAGSAPKYGAKNAAREIRHL